MPKDINPMPPRTFRGGFLFVQINPHPSKAAIQAGKENCVFSVSVGDILERRLRHLFHVISNECSIS